MGENSTRPLVSLIPLAGLDGPREPCHCRQVPGRRVARIVEPRRQLTRGELWGREGDAMEGELARCLGMCQRYDELDLWCMQRKNKELLYAL
jgi:hypothetical protein